MSTDIAARNAADPLGVTSTEEEHESCGPTIDTAERTEKGRAVEFTWDLGEVPVENSYDRDRRALAVLRISHTKAGINYWNYERTTEDYFSVSINREYSYATDSGFKMRSFEMGNGLGILRVPAGNRYSAKKLREAVEAAVAHFETVKHDPRIARYFDKDESPSLRDRA